MVIGIDIVNEWLFATYSRVKKAEFVLSWVSFICTLVLTALMPVQVPALCCTCNTWACVKVALLMMMPLEYSI